MGGYGSGRWERPTRKTCVEACRVLDVSDFSRHKLLRIGTKCEVCWTPEDPVAHVASIKFRVGVNQEGGHTFYINYDWSNYEKSERIEIPIRLEMTRPNFGGLRWWFRCPLFLDGEPCNRRASKLYLPPEGRYFGCRRCHQLTYRSSQEAHWFERLPARCDRMEKYLEKILEEQWRRSTRSK